MLLEQPLSPAITAWYPKVALSICDTFSTHPSWSSGCQMLSLHENPLTKQWAPGRIRSWVYLFISTKYSLPRIWCNAMFWHRCSNNACVTLAYAWAKIVPWDNPEPWRALFAWIHSLGFFITLRFEKAIRMAFLRSPDLKKCPSVSVSVRVLQRNRTSRKIWNKELAHRIMETEKCYNLWSVSWSLGKASGAGLVPAHGPQARKADNSLSSRAACGLPRRRY